MTKNDLRNWQDDASLKRQDGKQDPHRPKYHFLPPAGWLNDPNGLIKWGGHYHLFYQHNPHRAAWGPPYWGHAASEDLVHWRDYPIALAPEMPPADDGGCWSGCMVDDHGVPTMVYTGVKKGEQATCLAYGDPTLISWRKHNANPIATVPALPVWTHGAYRDPFVWREDNLWYQVLGTSIGGRGQVLLYRSKDLKRWEFLHPLVPQEVREQLDDIGHTWECPNFLSFGEQHVLIVSLWHDATLTYPIALIGEYRRERFYPNRVQRLDSGYRCFYAPLTMRDEQNRILMWGWLQEQRSLDAQLSAGWSGVMSLPRSVSLGTDGLLQFSPVAELHALRRTPYRRSDERIQAGEWMTLDASLPFEAELKISLELSTETTTMLTFQTVDIAGEDHDVLSLTYERGTLKITDSAGIHTQQGNSATSQPDLLELSVFLDRSVVEIFTYPSGCHSARLYEMNGQSLKLQVRALQPARLISYQRWNMASIW